jgi:glycogen operon protein
MQDLVSYNEKHNLANGEENRDGESHNRSWNCGVEGPTRDAAVLALRARQKRNFLATLLLSQGVPMIVAGDELGRTQQGNNNAYCHDSPLSWIDWANADDELCEYVRELVELRAAHPTFRRRRWLLGRPIHGASVEDIAWFRPDGGLMRDEDWQMSFARSIGVFLNGHAIGAVSARGERIVDETFFLMLNAWHEAVDFVLPDSRWGSRWATVLDTVEPRLRTQIGPVVAAAATLRVGGRAMVLLRRES